MTKYTVTFNNGVWEDSTSFKVMAETKQAALENVLSEHPEYSNWNNFIV